MISVYLTSFFRSHHLPEGVARYSAAVYPPKGYEWMEKAQWTDIRNGNKWTRPRDFINEEKPLVAYRIALMTLYQSRLNEAEAWLRSQQTDFALCCWCPQDKAAQRQLKEWGSFVCHTAVLGEFISANFHMPVWYDSDRLRLAVLNGVQSAKAV